MKVGFRSDARLEQVMAMDGLRRRAAAGDAEAQEQLGRLVNDGRLVCNWERGEVTNVVPLMPRTTAAGTRLQVIEGQIGKAACTEERSQFELRRADILAEEEAGAKKKKKKKKRVAA